MTTATKQAQRTPGPWTTVSSVIKAGLDAVAECSPGINGAYDYSVAKANAAFIVTACNAHDALVARVAELERQVELARTFAYKVAATTMSQFSDARADAKELLAALKGQA